LPTSRSCWTNRGPPGTRRGGETRKRSRVPAIMTLGEGLRGV
jgi:hypothetical protein